MKNIKLIIASVLTIVVGSAKGQFAIINENGYLNTIGVEYKFNKNFGVYVKGGTNLLFKDKREYDVKGRFTSSVDWYGENGSYYPGYPPSKYFVSSEWGNQLLESGSVSNIVETWNTNYRSNRKLIDGGFVVSKNNLSIRIGGGIHKETRVGKTDYRYWQHDFKVNKYYDEWDIIPGNIFIVSFGGVVKEYDRTTIINEEIIKPNFSVSVSYWLGDYVGMGLGYDSQAGLNFGMTFPL